MNDSTPNPLTDQGVRLIEDESDDWSLHDRGIEVLREAVKAGEEAAPQALALALTERGRLEEVAEVLEPVVLNGRNDLAGLLADTLDELDRPEESERFYRLAIEHGDTDALNDFGVFLGSQERYDEAIEVYRRAMDAGDELAAGNLVNLYADDLEDLPQALELGKQYLDEEKPSTYSALANVHVRLGDLDEAQRLYEKAIELQAPRAHLHFALFLQDRRDDAEGAERHMRAAQERDETGWGYYLGRFLLEQERYDEAADVLSHAAHWGDLDAQELLDQEFEEVPADPES